MMASWKRSVAALKREAIALSLAARDPRMPWTAKAVIVLVLAYAFSPIDLIPDFIPVLGQLDDLVLVPLGIALAIKLTPPEVLAEARANADAQLAQARPPRSLWGAALVVAGWALALALVALAWNTWGST